ncbi:flippase [Vibrio breoganii]
MLDRVLLKNIFSLFSLRVAGYLIPLVTLPYLGRVLGVEQFGQLLFAIGFANYGLIVANYGFELTATQKIAAKRDDDEYVSSIFWNTTLIRACLATTVVITIYISALFFEQINVVKNLILISCVGMFANALFPIWLFRGKEELGKVSTSAIVLQLLVVPTFLLFVKDEKDVNLAAIIYVIPVILNMLFSFYLVHKSNWIVKFDVSFKSVKQELVDGWYVFISNLSVTFHTSGVLLFLGMISGPVSVAIYGTAYRLYAAAMGLYDTLSQSFYPRISKLVSEGADSGSKAIFTLLKLQLVLSIFLGFAIYFLGPFFLELLFGSEFSDSSSVLKVFAFLPFLNTFGGVFGIQTLLTHGYRKEYSNVYLYCSLISIFVIPLLTYRFNVIGSVSGVLIVQACISVSMFYVVKTKNILNFSNAHKEKTN